MELDQWQREQINKGIEAANLVEFVPENQMRAYSGEGLLEISIAYFR